MQKQSDIFTVSEVYHLLEFVQQLLSRRCSGVHCGSLPELCTASPRDDAMLRQNSLAVAVFCVAEEQTMLARLKAPLFSGAAVVATALGLYTRPQRLQCDEQQQIGVRVRRDMELEIKA